MATELHAPNTGTGRVPAVVKRSAARALDLLLPPRCLACRAETDRPGELCAPCWAGIRFVDGPMCAACGFPFDYELGPGTLCAACSARRPAFERARAVMVYDDNSRNLVLALKHGDRLEGVPTLAKWMARAGRDLLNDADLIAPVPLHRWRLLSRRYNQSAILANRISRITGVPAVPDLLARVRPTPPQGGRSRSQRRLNVRGAFTVRAQHAPGLGRRRVVLVDDVMTTGATVEACARTLMRAGAAGVDVLILARVVRVVPAGV
jgi:ComF family protein